MTPFLWVIGDSWSDPRSYWWAPTQNCVGLLADRLGVGLINSAVSGSGYAATAGTPTFPAQAAQGWGRDADVVIVFGGVNDAMQSRTIGETVAGAQATYELLGRLCPDAVVLVIGPQYGAGAPPPSLLATRDAVAAVAGNYALPFVDVSQWLLGRPDLALDQYHPNPAGHAELADRLEHDVALAFATRSTLRV